MTMTSNLIIRLWRLLERDVRYVGGPFGMVDSVLIERTRAVAISYYLP